MKTLSEFYSGTINEYRTKKQAVEDIKDQQDITLDDVKGKAAEDNGTEGVWGVEEPTEDDIMKGIDKTSLTDNKREIIYRLKTEKPFFVQGEAGWGKTSLITQIAHQMKRTVITVYLDKCEAVDLAGIPVPGKSKKGADYVKNLMPGWAKIMYDRPNDKFLLFFDEMNQAAPDVMNALMPIVLKTTVCGVKFNNFVVGAAGNFERENDAVNELSGPLLSRFGGIIEWEVGDWDDTFKYYHKKWDDKLGKETIDAIRNYAPLFKNPRDVESFIVDTLWKMKQDEDKDLFDAKFYLKQIKRLVKKDLTRDEQAQLPKFAELMDKFIKLTPEEAKKEAEKKASGRRKSVEQVDKGVLKAIKQGMKLGYIDQDEDVNGKIENVKYGISRENILTLLDLFEDDVEMNAEMLERIVDKFEADGVKFKFEKDSEWKKAGFKDPQED